MSGLLATGTGRVATADAGERRLVAHVVDISVFQRFLAHVATGPLPVLAVVAGGIARVVVL